MRLPRNIQPGAVYHLISRFVDRNWYITTEEERANYVRLLGRAVAESDWRCLSYGVMSNHVHLGTVAGHQPLDGWIRRVHAPFADSMNRTHGRIGVMFVRGPKAKVVQADGVADLIAYIHNNPVRAEIVATAAESTWTSHRAYVGLESAPSWLSVEEGLARAGFRDRAAFDQWVALPPSDPGRFETEEVPVDDPPRARRRRPRPGTVEPDAIVTTTAAELGLTIAQLCSRRRGAAEVIARKVAVQCATALGVTGVDIAAALRMSQQGVSALGQCDVGDDVRALSDRVLERLGPTGGSGTSGTSGTSG